MDRRIVKTRERLKHALIALILVDDYQLLTIEQICQEAGCARSTFYSHYDHKEDLLVEVIEGHIAEIKQLTDTRFEAETDFYDYLQAFMRRFVRPHRALYQRLWMIELGQAGFRQRLDQLYRALFLERLGHLKSSDIFSQYFSAMALTTTHLMLNQALSDQDIAHYAILAQQMCQAIIEGSQRDPKNPNQPKTEV